MKIRNSLVLISLAACGQDFEILKIAAPEGEISNPFCQTQSVEDGVLISCPGQEPVLVEHGEAGAAGINGIDGTNGLDGQDGIDGINGADGAVGPAGPTGPQGPAGPTGPQGPPGASYTLKSITPCPDNTSVPFPETLLCLDDTTLYAVYDGGHGYTRLVALVEGPTYVTTDGRSCVFKVGPSCTLSY